MPACRIPAARLLTVLKVAGATAMVRHRPRARAPVRNSPITIVYISPHASPPPVTAPASGLCSSTDVPDPGGTLLCAQMPVGADRSSRRPPHPRGEPAGSLAPEHRLQDRSFACLPDRTTVPGAQHDLVNRGAMTVNVPPMLNVFRRDTDNQAVVTLTGEIDMDSAPLVRESLGQCLRDGIRTIDVDATTVTFCDCSGLSTFLLAFLCTTSVGGSLHLHHPSPALERLVALTGSESLFFTLPGAPRREPTDAAAAARAAGRSPAAPVVPVGPAGGVL